MSAVQVSTDTGPVLLVAMPSQHGDAILQVSSQWGGPDPDLSALTPLQRGIMRALLVEGLRVIDDHDRKEAASARP